jgi:AcrR family transcriptional regulator
LARTKGARNADYDAKRSELLARLLPRFVDRGQGRPSLRQFAAAAGVTMPTLRHYFGDRSDVVGAVLEEYRRLGETRLERVATPAGDFASSIRGFARDLVAGLQAQGGPARLGDVFSASLSEGLADPEISPLALRYVLDPAVEALERRLNAHLERGEMRKADLRAAALTLIAPLLLAVLHQDQMQGASVRPVALHALADEVADAFIRAYGASNAAPSAVESQAVA